MTIKGKEKILYETKNPVIIIAIGIILYAISFSIFSYHVFWGELPPINGLLYFSLSFWAIDRILCAHSGKIIFTSQCIKVDYFFPWEKSKTIIYKSIKDIKSNYKFYRLYSIVFIEDSEGIKTSFKILSNFGFLKDVQDFELKVKEIYNISIL